MGTGRKINLKDRIAKFLGFTSKAYEQFDAPSDKNLAGTKQRFWSKRSSPVSTSNNHASNSVPVGRSKGGQSDSTSSGEQANARAGSTSFPSSNSTNRDARAALPDVRGLDSNALAQLSPEQRDRALQELVSLLSQGSAEQRAQAAEALFNSTSEDELARQKISALGVVEPLVDLLRQGSDQGQMYAAYTLSALTSIDMSRTDMREHGAIPALIEILQHSTFLVAKKGAMRALGRLARNDDAAMEIVKTGGVPAIVALLQSDDLSLIRRCLIALYFIGADKEPLQAEIAKAGAVPVLVQLCKSDNAEVQAEAADVLKVLARNPECAQLIWRCGGNEALQHVAEHGLHPKSKHCAVKALQRLGEVEEYRQQIIRTGGTAFLEMNPESNEVEQLADIVSRGDPWVRAQAAQAIAEVSDDDPRISKDLAASGVLKPLVHLLEHGTTEGRASAASALAKMANDVGVREQTVNAGAIVHLIRAAADLRGHGQEGACTALEKLASHQHAVKQIVQEGGVPVLVAALDCGSALAQLRAARALYLLSGTDSDKVLDLIADNDGVAALVRRCWRGSSGVKAVALALLKRFARRAGHQAVLVGCGVITILVVLQQTGDGELKDLSQVALEALAGGPEVQAAVEAERELQGKLGATMAAVAAGMKPLALPPVVEEAMRMVPRGLFVPHVPEAWGEPEVSSREPALVLPPLHIDAMCLAALDVRAGCSLLDIGCGSGFVTCLGAYLAGAAGQALGVDTDEEAVKHAQSRAASVQASRALMTPQAAFRCEDFLALIEAGDTFDRVHVGGYVPKPWLPQLLKLLRRNGRMSVPVDDRVLLLQHAKGLEGAEVIGTFSGYQPLQLPSTRPTGRSAARRTPSSARRGSSTNGAVGSSPSGKSSSKRVPSRLPAAPRSPSSGGRRTSGGAGSAGDGAAGSEQARSRGGSVNAERQLVLRPAANGAAAAAGAAAGAAGAAADGKADARDGGVDSSDGDMERIQKEIEEEQMNGLLMTMGDIEICRNHEGKKCRLGEGGFGVVYKALMNGVDEVAVKLVKADRPSPKEMDLFLKEVRTLSKLHHRNIVQFYGACLEPGNMFFVTELMKGGDLYSALRNHPDTMRWDKLGKKVALDVALGINYLHSRKPPMMHRDLKSPNVLLSEEGVAKIADVGMVRSQVKELVTAQPVMTPLWAAPEVMRHERASIKADIWSYGILIWELVSGEDITEYQPLAISKQIGTGSKGKTMVLPPNCPSVARLIFEQCSHLEAEMRPTASQVVEWLRYDR